MPRIVVFWGSFSEESSLVFLTTHLVAVPYGSVRSRITVRTRRIFFLFTHASKSSSPSSIVLYIREQNEEFSRWAYAKFFSLRSTVVCRFRNTDDKQMLKSARGISYDFKCCTSHLAVIRTVEKYSDQSHFLVIQNTYNAYDDTKTQKGLICKILPYYLDHRWRTKNHLAILFPIKLGAILLVCFTVYRLWQHSQLYYNIYSI